MNEQKCKDSHMAVVETCILPDGSDSQSSEFANQYLRPPPPSSLSDSKFSSATFRLRLATQDGSAAGSSSCGRQPEAQRPAQVSALFGQSTVQLSMCTKYVGAHPLKMSSDAHTTRTPAWWSTRDSTHTLMTMRPPTSRAKSSMSSSSRSCFADARIICRAVPAHVHHCFSQPDW